MIVALHKINTMSDNKRYECGIGKRNVAKENKDCLKRKNVSYLSEKAGRTLEERENRGIGLNWERR